MELLHAERLPLLRATEELPGGNRQDRRIGKGTQDATRYHTMPTMLRNIELRPLSPLVLCNLTVNLFLFLFLLTVNLFGSN
jgi:hypothetical protein